VTVILSFFAGHWLLSVFFQTFFLHRYGAHKMFTMSKGWERFFHLMTWLTQGSSYLVPRAYAILHRAHHAYSDTEKDPHSPHFYSNPATMMWTTKEEYEGYVHGTRPVEERFLGETPEWDALDRFGNSWTSRIGFGAVYTLVYLAYAPHWAFFALLPIHFLMGPVHGAIVNWCGHKYGYRNYDTNDRSRNTLVFDFLTLGELFQNNHHTFGMAPNFAARRFEIDPTWQVIRLFAALGIIELAAKPQVMRYPLPTRRKLHVAETGGERVGPTPDEVQAAFDVADAAQ
jgi:stearoyl-CoA desaturase (delta-9 desaturase)